PPRARRGSRTKTTMPVWAAARANKSKPSSGESTRGGANPKRRWAKSTCRAIPAGLGKRWAGRRKKAHSPIHGIILASPSERIRFMLPEQQKQLISHIETAVRGLLPDAQPTIVLERPKVAAHGDIACNAAMQLAKAA